MRKGYTMLTLLDLDRTLDLVFQGMTERVKTIDQLADTTYKDKETLDLELILDKNYYTDLKSLHICFPVKFKILSNVAQDFVANLYPVNNLFAHWVNETNILKYGINKRLLPTTTSQEI